VDRESTHAPREAPVRLGLFLFLVSVSAMFTAALVAYGVTRNAQQAQFVARGVPVGVWMSTGLLVMLTGAIHLGKKAALDNAPRRCHRALTASLFLAVAFCAAQVLSWRSIYRLEELRHTMYAFTFYMLTGLHVLHVFGGIIPLAWITRRAGQGEYSSSRAEPLRLITIYWDFLSVIWLVLLTTLVLGS